MVINKYNVVQTGANIQSGGLKLALVNEEYHGSLYVIVAMLPIKDAEYVIKAKIKKDAQRIRSKKSEVDRLVCDNSKILKSTQWKPKIKIDKGLDITINWFKKFKDLFRHDIYHV